MDRFETQSVASTSSTLVIEKGRSFAFVSGLGGKSIRKERRGGNWWASIYTSKQDADFGALFCTFNADGDPDLRAGAGQGELELRSIGFVEAPGLAGQERERHRLERRVRHLAPVGRERHDRGRRLDDLGRRRRRLGRGGLAGDE